MNSPVEKSLVTTVTPVYRGEHYLRDLVEELRRLKVLWEEEDYPFVLVESIFVDDSSVDGSRGVLAELEVEFPWVRVITLSRNFGQHPATEAGMLHSSGDWVVTLDEDLQHPPEKITALLELALSEGSDIVYASPEKSVHGSLFRDGASRLSKWITGTVTGNPYVKHFNSFRLVRGNIARGAASVCGHDLYLDLALGWFTNRISPIKLPLEDKRYQEAKASGYTFRKLLSHWRRLFISSQVRMLRIGAGMGIFAMSFAIIYAINIFLDKLLNPGMVSVQGWPSTMVTILFIGGMTLFLLSLIIEYLGVILLQSQGKPTYFMVDRSQDAALLEALRSKQNRDSV